MTALIEPFGATRLPAIWDVTLRAEKMVGIGERQTLYFIFDLFNVFIGVRFLFQ